MVSSQINCDKFVGFKLPLGEDVLLKQIILEHRRNVHGGVPLLHLPDSPGADRGVEALSGAEPSHPNLRLASQTCSFLFGPVQRAPSLSPSPALQAKPDNGLHQLRCSDGYGHPGRGGQRGEHQRFPSGHNLLAGELGKAHTEWTG